MAHTQHPERYSEDGFMLDEWDREIGHCNSCGEEAYAYEECCEDGEVIPWQ